MYIDQMPALYLDFTSQVDRFKDATGDDATAIMEEAGVDTVVELAKRVPKNLFEKMVEINNTKKLVRKMPVEKQVADWVEQAKKRPRLVGY